MTRTTRVTQVLSLLLVTLTMGQLYAHVLELGPKMHYPPELYLRLNTSLYAWYGPPLGAAINTGAVIATGALAWMVHRQRSALLLTGTAFALQVAELADYFARVEPVNARFRALSPGQVPSDFIALRAQWEYGHALGFALYAVAFLLLVLSLVRLAAQSRATEPSARLPSRSGCRLRQKDPGLQQSASRTR
ncbi:MAG: hypothetical protein M3Y73_21735 [Actinomycetota bacterium]|nr:hypothetical protein [Actinomycetota bacterium]